MIKNLKRNRGFVILFAVTLSAILLSIALGVANVTLKEIKFSTSAKNTNEAFFAADIGVECAFVHDKSTSSVFINPNSPSFTCNNQSVTANKTSGLLIWNFIISRLGNTSTGCAKVTVDKTAASTTITSKGYDKGGGSGACTPGPNSVEREFVSTYDVSGSSPPTPPTCTSWTYSSWGACQPDNTQTRTVLTSSPTGCSGGSPILMGSCTYTPPTCTSWTYSSWGACQSGNIELVLNGTDWTGATGATPPNNWTTQGATGTNNFSVASGIIKLQNTANTYVKLYQTIPVVVGQTYKASAIMKNYNLYYGLYNFLGSTQPPPNGQTQNYGLLSEDRTDAFYTKTKTFVATTPNLYWTYFGESTVANQYGWMDDVSLKNISNGTQTRIVITSSPAGCSGGSPVLTQSCTYVPP